MSRRTSGRGRGSTLRVRCVLPWAPGAPMPSSGAQPQTGARARPLDWPDPATPGTCISAPEGARHSVT
eukprot:scaffold17509_cov40-Prasinocladus_malaysianus.AAC.1